jgi:hypothetical protein
MINNNSINKKRFPIKVIYICLLCIPILYIGFLHLRKNSSYSTYKIISSLSNLETTSNYINYRNGIIRYEKNGAVYIKEGKIIWNYSYEMNDPIVDVCEEYAVISDRGNKLLCIFNEKKCVGRINTLNTIITSKISSKGVVAVMMSDHDNYYVQLYYENGPLVVDSTQENMLVDMKMGIEKYGHLIDFAISKDGKKIVLNMLNLTSGKIRSNLGFYNYGEVGQNKIDRLVGGLPYENIIFPKIVFLNNDLVCAFKDKGFMIYSMPETPELVVDKTFEGKIKSVIYNEKYVGVVLEEESSPSKILLFNLKGKKILDKKFDFEYSHIFLSGNEIIMYNETTCYILRTNGTEKFRHTFDDIKAFLPCDSINRYVLVNELDILEIELSSKY